MLTKALLNEGEKNTLDSIKYWRVNKQGDCLRAILGDIFTQISNEENTFHKFQNMKRCKRCPSTKILSRGKLQDFVIVHAGDRRKQNVLMNHTLSALAIENIPVSFDLHRYDNRLPEERNEENEMLETIDFKIRPYEVFQIPEIRDCMNFLEALVYPTQSKYLVFTIFLLERIRINGCKGYTRWLPCFND